MRRVKNRRRLRTGGFFAAGAAVVIVLVLLTTGVFSSSPPKKKSATGTTTTTTAAPTTTTTTASASQDASLQAAANKVAVAAKCPATPKARVNTKQWSSPPALTIDTSKTYTAAVNTTAGSFTIALDAKTAPHTVNNFVFLAEQDFYNCVIFHRVITGFMDQTGDPTGTGKGGPGYEFANENVPSAYATGDVAMAHSGVTNSDDGSQFFIVVPGGATTLDGDLKSGYKYTLFGTVTSGLTVVEKINSEGGSTSTGKPKVTQRILSVTIHES